MSEGTPVPPGMIVCTTYGSVRVEMAKSMLEMRAIAERQSASNIRWEFAVATLVDKARNDAVRAVLADPNLQWLWFIDADMQFSPELIHIMLASAYGSASWADVLGGYCNLRGSPYMPTIDTGTGTWEPTLPNQGVLEVIRTGAACLLIKRHVLEQMKAPWFGIRTSPKGLDAMTNFDNYARIKFDGRNPFSALPEWEQLFKCAREESSGAPEGHEFHTVGEDSNFCDRSRALGFRIAVNTDAVVGHVDTKVITADDHIKAIHEMRENGDLIAGVGS